MSELFAGSSSMDDVAGGDESSSFGVLQADKGDGVDEEDDHGERAKKQQQKEKRVQFLSSIRVKTLSVLILLFIIIVVLCLAILIATFQTSYTNLEYNTAVTSSKRVSRSIFDTFRALYVKLLEYAPWDDSYGLFTGKTDLPTYMSSNFFCSYMENVGLSFAAFYYLNGTRLASSACYNATLEEELPTELMELSPDHFLLTDMNLSTTRKATYMVPSINMTNHDATSELITLVAMPVLMSDYSGDPLGILLFGTYQTAQSVVDMASRTQLCVSFYNILDDSSLSLFKQSIGYSDSTFNKKMANFESVSINVEDSTWVSQSVFGVATFNSDDNTLSKNRQCFSDSGNSGTRMASYQIMKDVNRNSSIVVRTDMSRDIYTDGINSFLITWGVMTGMLLLLSAAVLIFVEIVVLRRMIQLSNFVLSIAENWKQAIISNVRVPIFGSDEVGILAKKVNYMLSILEKAYKQLQKEHALSQNLLDRTSIEEQKYRNVMNAIPDFIVTVQCESGAILSYNSAFESKVMDKASNENAERNNNNKLINRYFDEDIAVDGVLQKLEDCSKSGNGSIVWETNIKSRYSKLIPVSVTCSRVQILLAEGEITNAYVVLARNMSESQELKQAIKNQQQQFTDMKQNMAFDYIWKNKEAREKLRLFAMQEMSYENISFLESVELYKKTKKTQERAKMQQAMIEKYLTTDSKYEINISQEEYFMLAKKIEDGYGQIDLFDKLAIVVKNMVIKDTFQRFMIEYEKESEGGTSTEGEDTSSESSNISSGVASSQSLR